MGEYLGLLSSLCLAKSRRPTDTEGLKEGEKESEREYPRV